MTTRRARDDVHCLNADHHLLSSVVDPENVIKCCAPLSNCTANIKRTPLKICSTHSTMDIVIFSLNHSTKVTCRKPRERTRARQTKVR